jgi:iron(III) transport system substrate-binding protein
MPRIIPAFVLTLMVAALGAAELNIYSARHYGGDAGLFAAFTKATGIKVNVIEDKGDKLLARIRAEGKRSPADVLITVDAGRLAAATPLLGKVESSTLVDRLPANLRHPEGKWFAYGLRTRILFYHPDRFDPATLSTYEQLADPALKGKISIRSSGNIYNQSLLAGIIAAHGEEQAEAWAKGVVANFAREPQGNDRAQIKAVAAGEADIAVANHYYYFKMLDSGDAEQVEAAKAVKWIIPNQGAGERGAHVNISGAGMVATAPNPDSAKAFLEFLASDEGQALFTAPSYELPAVPSVKADHAPGFSDVEFTMDQLPASVLGTLNATAVKVFDRAGWR